MSDFDGDLAFTTSQQEFISCAKGGNPISYEKRNASKTIPNDEVTATSDLAAMNCKVGFITNVSSTYHCMLSNYLPGTREYIEIEKRLKSLRREQGNTIDAGKGVVVDEFPQHWVKFQPKSDEIDEETRFFENKILADKRPLFFVHLYDDYKRKYQKEMKNFDSYLKMKYGVSYEALVKAEKTKEQQEDFDIFYRHSFFIHNSSPMNKVSEYIQSKVKTIRNSSKNLFYDWSFIGERNCSWLEKYYKKYTAMKRALSETEEYDSIEQISHAVRKMIQQENSSMYENAKDAIWMSHLNRNRKEFLWKVFGNEVVDILLDLNDRNMNYPYKDENGSVEFLFQRYSFRRVQV